MSFIKTLYKCTFIRCGATVRKKDERILQIKNPIILVYYLFKVILYNSSTPTFTVFNAYCSKLALLNHSGLSDRTPESPACVNVVHTPLFQLKQGRSSSFHETGKCLWVMRLTAIENNLWC